MTHRPCEAHASGVWMYRTRLLYVIGTTLWSAAVACSQTVPSTALSEALRDHVKNGHFGIVTSTAGLPAGVQEALRRLFGSQILDMAEPGAEFQIAEEVVKPNLPPRRMVAAGCSTEYCLVYYERGGVAHTWHVALFHWTPAMTRFEWGGTAPGSLATIDDVRNAILSGAIRSPATSW